MTWSVLLLGTLVTRLVVLRPSPDHVLTEALGADDVRGSSDSGYNPNRANDRRSHSTAEDDRIDSGHPGTGTTSVPTALHSPQCISRSIERAIPVDARCVSVICFFYCR